MPWATSGWHRSWHAAALIVSQHLCLRAILTLASEGAGAVFNLGLTGERIVANGEFGLA